MHTITLKEAKKRLRSLIGERENKEGYYDGWEKNRAIKDLLELTYKSGYHDGWHDVVDNNPHA